MNDEETAVMSGPIIDTDIPFHASVRDRIATPAAACTPPILIVHGTGDTNTVNNKGSGPNPSLDDASTPSKDPRWLLSQLAERQTTDFTTEIDDADAQLSNSFEKSMDINKQEDPPASWYRITAQDGVISDWQGAFDVLKDGLHLRHIKNEGEDLARYWLSSMETPLLPIQVSLSSLVRMWKNLRRHVVTSRSLQ